MTVIAIGFCLLVALLGGLGVASPPKFLDLIRRLTSLQGFYVIAVLRIAFGAVLYLAAPVSKLPALIETVGIVIVVAGIITPFFSHTRYRKVIEWWSAGGHAYVRIWAGCAFLFAILLAYVVLPEAIW